MKLFIWITEFWNDEDDTVVIPAHSLEEARVFASREDCVRDYTQYLLTHEPDQIVEAAGYIMELASGMNKCQCIYL